MVLTFLGSGDSKGVPRWWCDCSVCTEARRSGHNARARPSVLLKGTSERVLVDAAPELRLQLTWSGVKAVNALLITHAHNDHILGLGDVGDQARWTGQTTPIFTPREVIPNLNERFGYLWRSAYADFVPLAAIEDAARTFAGFRVSAHRVPHGANGYAYGLRFESAASTWAYVPDSIGIEDLSPWQSLDLLVLGTSFYQEDAPLAKRSIYDVREAAKLLNVLKPARAVFTHLGHGVDSRKPAPPGTQYAHDGLEIKL